MGITPSKVNQVIMSCSCVQTATAYHDMAQENQWVRTMRSQNTFDRGVSMIGQQNVDLNTVDANAINAAMTVPAFDEYRLHMYIIFFMALHAYHYIWYRLVPLVRQPWPASEIYKLRLVQSLVWIQVVASQASSWGSVGTMPLIL